MSASVLRAMGNPTVGHRRASAQLGMAVAVVVAFHAALLLVRPGGAPASTAVPAAPVMAIRVVPSISPTDVATLTALPGPAGIETPSPPPPRPSATSSLANEPRPGERSGPVVRATKDAEPGAKPQASSTAQAPASPVAAVPEVVAPAPEAAAPADKALPAAPDYAFGIRLDPGPRPLDDIDPDYPEAGNLREGLVVLRLLISAAGHVDNVAVVRAEPRGVFDQAALDAFGKARFSPGLAAGIPVKSQITVEVHFAPINRGGRVSGRTY